MLDGDAPDVVEGHGQLVTFGGRHNGQLVVGLTVGGHQAGCVAVETLCLLGVVAVAS